MVKTTMFFRNGLLLVTIVAPMLASCGARPLALLPSTVPTVAVTSSGGYPNLDETPLRNVIGRVYDSNGMPMAGHTVTCKMLNPGDLFVNGKDTYVAVIDEGDYGLANLKPPCSFTVTCDIPGYVPQTLRYDLTVGGPPVVRGPIFYLKNAPAGSR